MKKSGVTSAKTTVRFDAKKYVKQGISEDQVMEAKEAFDLFDVEGRGYLDPKCNP